MSESAEQLWSRAHEHVRRGDFAGAVRDLAACFQMLQTASDPRVYEVHKRWTEVHKMYLEDGARQEQAAPQRALTVEAEAEAAANAGDLDKAIALYEQAARQAPQNELVRERLQELVQAKRRATELVSGPPAAAPVTGAVRVAAAAAPTPAASAAATASAVSAVSAAPDDDWSDVALDEPSTSSPRPVPTAAKPMAVEDAPVGMQSLDVPFSVGPAIDAFQADDLPVAGTATAPPRTSDVAFLEELLTRVQTNRRPAA